MDISHPKYRTYNNSFKHQLYLPFSRRVHHLSKFLEIGFVNVLVVGLPIRPELFCVSSPYKIFPIVKLSKYVMYPLFQKTWISSFEYYIVKEILSKNIICVTAININENIFLHTLIHFWIDLPSVSICSFSGSTPGELLLCTIPFSRSIPVCIRRGFKHTPILKISFATECKSFGISSSLLN